MLHQKCYTVTLVMTQPLCKLSLNTGQIRQQDEPWIQVSFIPLGLALSACKFKMKKMRPFPNFIFLPVNPYPPESPGYTHVLLIIQVKH